MFGIIRKAIDFKILKSLPAIGIINRNEFWINLNDKKALIKLITRKCTWLSFFAILLALHGVKDWEKHFGDKELCMRGSKKLENMWNHEWHVLVKCSETFVTGLTCGWRECYSKIWCMEPSSPSPLPKSIQINIYSNIYTVASYFALQIGRMAWSDDATRSKGKHHSPIYVSENSAWIAGRGAF